VTARFDPWNCPHCGYLMDSASHAADGDVVPAEGDVAVCINCAEPHTLAGGTWRALTDDELIDMTLEEKQALSRVQQTIRRLNEAGHEPEK
jgi:hypothetical protein